MSRNYQYPDAVHGDEFRFGVATKGSESAKDVMYTPASLNTDQQARDLYIKSHGMYDAGKPYFWKIFCSENILCR